MGAPREEVAVPLTAATIAWLVETNPAGKGFVVVAKARTDDALAGYFLFYAKRLMVRHDRASPAEPLTVFLYVTLYVAPAYRRVGVFSAMTRYGLDLLERSGVPFAYTVPNPRSTPGFLKLGIGEIGQIPFWASPAGWPGIGVNVLGSVGALVVGAVDVEPAAAGFDARLGPIISAAPSGASVWGSRSPEELEWRFMQRPGVTYQVWNLTRRGSLIGYAVSRTMHIAPFSAVVLCDLWAGDSPWAAARGVAARLRRQGGHGWSALAVAIGGHSGPYSLGALLSSAMVPVPQRALPQPVALIGGPLGTGDGQAAWMRPGGSREWYVTPFDWDVF